MNPCLMVLNPGSVPPAAGRLPGPITLEKLIRFRALCLWLERRGQREGGPVAVTATALPGEHQATLTTYVSTRAALAVVGGFREAPGGAVRWRLLPYWRENLEAAERAIVRAGGLLDLDDLATITGGRGPNTNAPAAAEGGRA